LSKSNEILAANASRKEVQTLQILRKSRKGYAPAGRVYSIFWTNLSTKFSFGGPIPLRLHRWGWNLAWRRHLQSPPPRQISPRSVQRVET